LAATVLNNGLGLYEEAIAACRRAIECVGDVGVSNWALAELVGAAARSGAREEATRAYDRLVEMTTASSTEWALGVVTRSHALLSDCIEAERLYRQSIVRLGRTRVRTELARAHLVYGEWLRRENRRVDAREQLQVWGRRLRRAHGAGGAHRSAGVDGSTNPEIGAQMFLSARTVEWHLRKVFTKLGVTSRRELRESLARAVGVHSPS
jgi:hypothetical protein